MENPLGQFASTIPVGNMEEKKLVDWYAMFKLWKDPEMVLCILRRPDPIYYLN